MTQLGKDHEVQDQDRDGFRGGGGALGALAPPSCVGSIKNYNLHAHQLTSSAVEVCARVEPSVSAVFCAVPDRFFACLSV